MSRLHRILAMLFNWPAPAKPKEEINTVEEAILNSIKGKKK